MRSRSGLQYHVDGGLLIVLSHRDSGGRKFVWIRLLSGKDLVLYILQDSGTT